MTTTTTPALELADRLEALAAHLRTFPNLPYVVIHRGIDLQINGYQGRGEPVDAHAVLLWARTLTDPVLTLNVHGERKDRNVLVRVNGTIDGHQFEVWDVDQGELHRWLPADADLTPITLDHLSKYIAAGTVDGITR
jgi:hypothetical protein